MVDVSPKSGTVREAVAEGTLEMPRAVFELVKADQGPKGDVLRTAELAGVGAAKRVAELIPLCHQIPLDHVEVVAELDAGIPGIRIEARAKATWKTGVEMEALTAVSVALLTAYDMTKAAGHDMELKHVRLLQKKGGKSGDWAR